MAGWIKVREHVWPNEHGEPVLRHTKYLLPNGDVAFPWEVWIDFHNGTKPRWYDGDGKDDGIVHPLLYRRDLFEQADRTKHIHLVEGEADQEAAQAAGLLAVTAGAAGAFGKQHARLFRGWRGRITIVRDRDLTGAAGALKAYEALQAVGVPASRLRICRGRSGGEGGDLRDHLEQHGTAVTLVVERIERLRNYVERASSVSTPTNKTGHNGGSGHLVRDSDGFLINPHTGFVVSGPPMTKKSS